MERATAVRREVDRLSKMFTLNIISAPIWDVEGILLLDKYADQLVTTLHTSYQLSIENHPKWLEDEEYFNNHVSRIIAAEKRMLTESKHLIANSRAIVSCMNEAYALDLSSSLCQIIPHGVAAPRPKSGTPRYSRLGEITLLFLGRLEHRKGVDLLIESAALLLKKHANVRLLICGDKDILIEGKQHTYCEYFDAKYHLEDWYSRVDYLGFLPWEDVAALLHSCDVFVAPSRFESFGLIHAQGLAYGKPVVALDVAATPEVVSDDVGVLARVDDAVHLFECLDDLVSNPQRREEMGRAARDRYLHHYTIERMLSRTQNFYVKVVSDVK
jgi:glycosyltransferase involved in cell wall biosynthesis